MGGLEHHRTVAELLNQTIFALNGYGGSEHYCEPACRVLTGIGDFSNLVALETIPALM